MTPRARAAWRVKDRTGHGDWVAPADAQAWVDWCNAAFGDGTHWIKWEGEAA